MLPGHSKVNLAVDMKCQLQVCKVLGSSTSKLPGQHYMYHELSVLLSTFCPCTSLLVYFALGINSSYFHGPINLLKTKHNLLYIRNQSILRSEHFPPRL